MGVQLYVYENRAPVAGDNALAGFVVQGLRWVDRSDDNAEYRLDDPAAGVWTRVGGPAAARGGEPNTAANVGNGAGLFAQKQGLTLNFRSLQGASGIRTRTVGDTLEIRGADLLPLNGRRRLTGPLRGTRRDLSGTTTPVVDIARGNTFFIELSGNTTASLVNEESGDHFTLLVKQPDDARRATHTFAFGRPAGRELLKPDQERNLLAKTGAGARTLYTVHVDDGVVIVTVARLGPVGR